MVDLARNNGQEFMAALEDEIRGNKPDRMLISAEVAKDYIVENRYHRLFQNFRSLGVRQFRVMLYVRNPFHLVNAAYCQQTKNLALAGETIEEYVKRYVCEKYKGHYKFFNYEHVIKLAQKRDVEMIVRPYNAQVAKSVVTDFLAALGLPREHVSIESRSNISPGPIAMEALRTISLDMGTIEIPLRTRIAKRLNGLLDEFPEATSYWGVDEDIAASAALAKADHQTELLSRFAWKKPWRASLGDDRRPLNVLNLATASRGQAETFERMLGAMRNAVAEETR